MGIDPVTVGALSLWQYRASLAGWNAAHSPSQKETTVPAMTPARFMELTGQ